MAEASALKAWPRFSIRQLMAWTLAVAIALALLRWSVWLGAAALSTLGAYGVDRLPSGKGLSAVVVNACVAFLALVAVLAATRFLGISLADRFGTDYSVFSMFVGWILSFAVGLILKATRPRPTFDLLCGPAALLLVLVVYLHIDYRNGIEAFFGLVAFGGFVMFFVKAPFVLGIAAGDELRLREKRSPT